MALLHMLCYRPVRRVIVSFSIVVLLLAAFMSLRTNVEQLSLQKTPAAESAELSRDRIFGKDYKLPDTTTALAKKETQAKRLMSLIYQRGLVSKLIRQAGFFAQMEKEQGKNRIRFYSIYLLGVLCLLNKRSVISYLHKRDTTGGPARLFAL